METPEQCVNFEHISQIDLVFSLLTLIKEINVWAD